MSTINLSSNSDFTRYVSMVNSTDTFCGRKVLYAPFKSSEMTKDNIKEILESVFTTHLYNAKQIQYLYNYYKGVQPVLNKVKTIRPDINNKVLENNAFQIVEFKKGYVFGEPIQYVQRGDVASEEISKLNEYMMSENKPTKDKDIAEHMYCSGNAYRMILPDKNTDEDDAPFEIYTLDPIKTFVVYSSNYEHEKLFAGTFYDKQDKNTKKITRKFLIYTKKEYFEFESSTTSVLTQSKDITFKKSESHTLGAIPIFEYALNPARVGIVELVMNIFDTINKISSNDMDGIEQFIQALLVFINQDIEEEALIEMLTLGAVKIASSDPSRPADLKLLVSQMLHSETKIFYDRLMDSALAIAGIPRMNNKPSGGDTGQARLLGEGWTSADMRAKQDELAFIEAEKEMLKLVINICKIKRPREIKALKLKDIDVKFTRNKSDNLLVKTQGLMNMFEAQVDPETAFTVSGLFSDPHSAYSKALSTYGDKLWKVKRNDKANIFEQDIMSTSEAKETEASNTDIKVESEQL